MKLQSSDLYTGFLLEMGKYKIAPDYSENQSSKNYVVWSGREIIRRFSHYDSARRYVFSKNTE